MAVHLSVLQNSMLKNWPQGEQKECWGVVALQDLRSFVVFDMHVETPLYIEKATPTCYSLSPVGLSL